MTLRTRLQALYRQRWRTWLNRRIPPTRDLVLNQRRVFIFLSSNGGIMCLLLLSLFIAGVNYANNLLLGLCFFLGSLLVVTIHHTFANLSGLRIQAVGTTPSFAGDVAGFTVRLSSTSRRHYYSLDLDWDGVSSRVDEVQAGEDCTLFLRTPQRGRYHPPRLKISTVFPLGLLRAWTWLDLDLEAIVYPQPLPSDTLPAGSGGHEDAVHAQRRRPGQEDFESLRQFTPGDPLAHVSWKHLARGQGLLVKTYSEPVAGSDTLDYQAMAGLDKELRLSYLAWWIVRLHSQQQPYALRLPHRYIASGSGAQHRDECLTALALFEERA